MPAQLAIHAVHQGGMRVLARNGEHEVLTDYPLVPGQPVAGLTSLELLLASLATCSANSLMFVLGRSLKQAVTGVEVDARGIRRSEHPLGFAAITLEFLVQGEDLDPQAVAKAIAISEDQVCPVWNMLKGGTDITASFRIVPDAMPAGTSGSR